MVRPAAAPALAERARAHENLASGLAGLPLFLRAEVAGDQVRVDAAGFLAHPHALVTAALRDGGAWCEIVLLQLNVKACTVERTEAGGRIAIYAGRKGAQSPQTAREHAYDLRVVQDTPVYLRLELARRDGRGRPAVVEAGARDGRTYVRVHHELRLSWLARSLANGYFATIGRNKVGFSESGVARDGEPVLTRGMVGAIERNAVRYYFALQTYFETLSLPAAERAMRRHERWFELTEQYPRQLSELGREEYLAIKRRERLETARLQYQLEANLARHD